MENQLKLSLFLLGVAASAPALLSTQTAYARPANVKVHTPKPGSRERSAIMNALRIPLSKFHKGKRVTFTGVINFQVGGGWAYLDAQTIDANNKPLGPEYPLEALLHLKNGRWQVIEWAYVGNEDIVSTWARKHPSVPLNVVGIAPEDVQ